MNTKNVFISVLYRSGSTLLILMLKQSKEITMSYDMIHFMRFSYGKYVPIEKRYKQLLKDSRERIMKKWRLDLDTEEIEKKICKHKKITQAIVYDTMVRSFMKIRKNQKWGDRSAVRWTGIVPFLKMFPKGKTIHIYRDPRAVLCSYKYFTYHPGLMYLDAIFASLAMFNFIEQENIMQNDRVLLVKYEDLVHYPEKTMKTICKFLEIQFVKNMLKPTFFKDSFGKPFDGNSSFIGPRKKIEPSSTDIWKKKLSPVEIYLTEMVLKGKMQKFGYKPSGIDLTRKQFGQLYDILHSDFVYKRYKWWLKNANGLECYPDAKNAYRAK